MKSDKKVSVMIVTRNRADLLRKCLESLIKQTTKAYEIIVIDNNSEDNTKDIYNNFNNQIPLSYAIEKNIGASYARNKGLTLAKGDIIASIDDDCIANKEWISSIIKHFTTYPNSVGVIGKSIAIDKNNPYSLIEDVYMYRWLMQTIPNLNKTCKIKTGMVIDTKNAAFKSVLIKKHKYSTDITNRITSNEDVEMGVRLFTKNQNIYFNPSMIVRHQYSTNLKQMTVKNFWKGYIDQMLFFNKKIDLQSTPLKYSRQTWFCKIFNTTSFLSRINKIIFIIFLLIYPFFYKSGRLYAKIHHFLKANLSILQRR